MFQAQNRETKLVLEKLLCPPRSLWRRAWQDCISQHKTCKTKIKIKTDFLVSDRSCSMTDGLRPHHWSGGALWAPSVVGGGALTAQRFFFTIFGSHDGLSWHYNIVLLWIKKKWKILNPFNLESTTELLVMLFDVFLASVTKFTVGKWKVVVFTAGKRRAR